MPRPPTRTEPPVTPPAPPSQVSAESTLPEPAKPIKPDPPVVPEIPSRVVGRPGQGGLPPVPFSAVFGTAPPPNIPDPRDKQPKYVPPKVRKPNPLILP